MRTAILLGAYVIANQVKPLDGLSAAIMTVLIVAFFTWDMIEERRK